ncbi:hypothetical protein [Rathayibacter soli]|uniref:hypothetical protein n=1 Tax=Rathayibacter soli TaxID=3144168 RepID=UPI0027E422E3|nr:hypothetical protein [Glaciibacter superstes]
MAQDQKSNVAVFATIALFGVVVVNAGAVTMVMLATRNMTAFGIGAIGAIAAAVFVDFLAVRWLLGRRRESR